MYNMAKRYILNFGKYFQSIVSNIIREKEELLVLLLETIKLFQMGNIIPEEEKNGTVIIYIEKMSRVIYETDDKIFSINFPFYIGEDIGGYKTYSIIDIETGIVFDEIITSTLLSLIKNGVINNNSLASIYDELDNVETLFDYGGFDTPDLLWKLLRKLFLFECCYLRFDHDEVHNNGSLHPVDHLDISYCSSGTFKLGVNRKLNVTDFIDIINNQTECYYLDKGKGV
jgi:hypothetical protein